MSDWLSLKAATINRISRDESIIEIIDNYEDATQ